MNTRNSSDSSLALLKLFKISTVICIAVAVLSLTPSQMLPKASTLSDKMVHFIMYLAISVVVMWEGRSRMRQGNFFLLIWIFCSLYGVLLEVGQRFVPGRQFDWWDAWYNALGGFTGSIGMRILLTIFSRKK